MDKKELIAVIGELQGIKIDQDRAGLLTEPSGVWDMVQLIKSILFQADVTEARPQDDLKFDFKEAKP